MALLVSGGLRKAAFLFSSRSINSLLSLIFSLVVGRILIVEDYGLFGQSMARIVVFQAITEVGLQFSLVRFMAPAIRRGDRVEISALLRASLHLKAYAFSLVGIFTLVLLSLLIVFNGAGMDSLVRYVIPGDYPESIPLFWLIFLGGVGLSILSYLDAILVAHEYYYRLSLWIPSLGFFRLLMLGIFYFYDAGGVRAEHVVFSFSMAPFLSLAIYFFIFSPSFFFQSSKKEEWKPWVGKLLRFNVWIMAASFFSIVSDWMEILLIGDSHASGLYNAARMPMQGFLILLATMQSILLPKLSHLQAREEFAAFFKKIYRYIASGAVMLVPGFWIFSWFILEWYGPDYSLSVSVFYLLYPNFLLRLFFAPLGTALFALDQPRLIALEAALRMGSGLILNIILIPLYGIMGAAVASLLAQFTGWLFLSVLYFFYFKRGHFPFDKQAPV